MKTSAITMALAASVAAVAIEQRDFSTVLGDINSIGTKVQGLQSALSSFNSISDATALIAAESSLESAIKQATTDAQSTGAVTVDQANQVLEAVAALIPKVVGSLNAATAKASTFSSLGLSTVLMMDLSSLKSETDAFAAALIKDAPSAAQDSANAAVSCIDAAFSAALATQTANSACAASVTTIAGGSGSSSAPASSAGSSSAQVTSAGSSSAQVTSSTPTSTSGAASGSSATTSAISTFTGAANSLNAGVFGAVVAAGVALAL